MRASRVCDIFFKVREEFSPPLGVAQESLARGSPALKDA
jgi:hypothetical protein